MTEKEFLRKWQNWTPPGEKEFMKEEKEIDAFARWAL